MKIDLVSSSQNENVLVVFSTESKKNKQETIKVTHTGAAKQFAAAIEDKSISGKLAEAVSFRDTSFEGHRHVLVVGLGENPTHEDLRHVAASIHGGIKALKATTAAIDFDGIPSGKKDKAHHLQALVEGLLLTDYSFDELKSSGKKDKKPEVIKVHVFTKSSGDAALKKALHDGVALAESVNFSRRLGDMPGNLMTPTKLADTVVAAVKGTKIKATIWNKARIQKERMGGLLGVAEGSDQEPRFIILEYKGAAASKKPLVYVGKGLTFDTGGISIKPSAAMEEMKYDMCGGANVIGAILAVAELKLKVNMTVLVPATENMPSGRATKPGDVHTARNGKTFEVNNTDAEGRLILSDALCYATELKPEMIIDAATLTGAIVVALGNTHTGYFTRHAGLKKKIEEAATQSGEWVWNMPLTDFHVRDMKGTFADLSNISSGKGAGSATAAAFLEQFVGEGIPWAHFDIAGTAWAVGSRLPYCPKKGASGAMVRTFVELAKMHE